MKHILTAGLLASATTLAVVGFALEAQATERFVVRNYAASEIQAVFLMNKNGDRSKDLLGNNGTVQPNDEVLVLDAHWKGCSYDVIIFTADDRAGYFQNVNICTGSVNVSEKALEIRD